MSCSLCNVTVREPENTLWEDSELALVRTLKLKGHRERLMIVRKDHTPQPPKFIPDFVYEEVKTAFDYSKKVVVMEGKYGSIPSHWHLCVTDLDPRSEDYDQVLGTPWIRVIDVHPWR